MSQSPNALPQLSAAAERFLRAHGVEPGTLQSIPGDASARGYWRAPAGRVLAQVPHADELLPFLRVQHRFAEVDLPVPRIFAVSLQHRLLLQEDVGFRDLKSALDAGESPDALMARVFPLLLGLAVAAQERIFRPPLPAYDSELLSRELSLFSDWYLRRHLGVCLSNAEQVQLSSLFRQLTSAACQQPRIWVHRDFHARNLLLRPNATLVMIDFQDAVLGPYTYDLASLLWDRYWDWGRARRTGWIERYRCLLQRHGLVVPDAEAFRVQVEVLALQRNLKILGIFCRLAYRDGKTEYLQFLPRFWAYVEDLLAGQDAWRCFVPLFQSWSPCGRP
ncbi:phosphotransferase [Acidithiobacillus sp. AMEEHan]|uniref:aminoglycoside phosphotransferase family protein n=1 Tax=Acidithiobacillus sp. AMEEHan TaxID=2994951 RepID=UPI0027E432FC|nr:phosphotransferase [Acidithiobacillus sp. AMEEHan]